MQRNEDPKTTGEADISAVVSLIYENIFAPKSWKGLAERGNAKGSTPDTLDQSPSILDAPNLERALPYLEQALALAAKQHSADATQSARAALFEELPLPACIVSKDLRLLNANSHAEDALALGKLLELEAGYLHALEEEIEVDLVNAVSSTIATGQSQMLNWTAKAGATQSILIVRSSWGDTDDPACVALILNVQSNNIGEMADILIEVHGLTQSEAEVAALLAQGLSLEQISSQKSTSVNTVRTQIKHIFSKTGARRQGELISLVLNGPARWLHPTKLAENTRRQNLPDSDNTENLLTLDDGRILSFGDYGPRGGKPMFLFHHLLGSRTETPADPELLTRLGIRLIVPERPGVGLSTPCEESRSLSDWTEDVRALADHLGQDRFYVVGLSSGGPYAAACAALLKERVIKAGLVASMMPFEELPQGTEVSLQQRFMTNMAQHWPAALQKLLEVRYRKLLQNPEQALPTFENEGNAADIALLNDPEIHSRRLQNFERAANIPRKVFAVELITLSRPWGFKLSEVGVPVMIWHGRQDDFFPVEHAEAMAQIIPNCEAQIEEVWGHFFLYREWESILGGLIK